MPSKAVLQQEDREMAEDKGALLLTRGEVLDPPTFHTVLQTVVSRLDMGYAVVCTDDVPSQTGSRLVLPDCFLDEVLRDATQRLRVRKIGLVVTADAEPEVEVQARRRSIVVVQYDFRNLAAIDRSRALFREHGVRAVRLSMIMVGIPIDIIRVRHVAQAEGRQDDWN